VGAPCRWPMGPEKSVDELAPVAPSGEPVRLEFYPCVAGSMSLLALEAQLTTIHTWRPSPPWQRARHPRPASPQQAAPPPTHSPPPA
jgi:hypothetical protein